jgi:hypothetical protein
MFKKISGAARIFCKNEINIAEDFDCPVSNVFKITDRSGDEE